MAVRVGPRAKLVIPAKAGIHADRSLTRVDPGVRRDDSCVGPRLRGDDVVGTNVPAGAGTPRRAEPSDPSRNETRPNEREL